MPGNGREFFAHILPGPQQPTGPSPSPRPYPPPLANVSSVTQAGRVEAPEIYAMGRWPETAVAGKAGKEGLKAPRDRWFATRN